MKNEHRDAEIISEELNAYLARHPGDPERERLAKLLAVSLEVMRRGIEKPGLLDQTWPDDFVEIYERIMARLLTETDWGRR